jgi:small subunit ribosomal protein S17
MTDQPQQQQAEGGTRAQRTAVIGQVVSARMKKTITVEVERLVRHPLYEKFTRRRTRLHAHDENDDAKVGDLVEVAATRPISKLKRWRLVRVVRRAV